MPISTHQSPMFKLLLGFFLSLNFIGFSFAESITPTTSSSETTISGNTLASGNNLPFARVITVEGEFKPLMFVTVKKRTEQAIADNIKTIIYSIKSPGGRVDVLNEQAYFAITLPEDVRTIAFVDVKAYSAAAMFSLTCDEIYMSPHSSIGDSQPILMTSEGYTVVGEKGQSPLRERAREFARTNGYPPLLAQAMITEEWQILEVEDKQSGQKKLMRQVDWDINKKRNEEKFEILRIVNHEGELLTMGPDEAIDLGFSSGTVKDIPELLKKLNLNTESETAELDDTEKFIDAFDPYTGALLAFAIFFLFLEGKTPGIGLFGSLSAVCFGAFFIGKYYTGQANYLEILFFCIGAALLIIEIFVIPGFGVAGIVGLGCILASLILAMQEVPLWGEGSNWNVTFKNLGTLSASFISAIALMVLFFIFFPKFNKTIPGLVHKDHDDKIIPDIAPVDIENVLHKEGIVMTPMHPIGKVEIDGMIMHANALNGWIDANIKVVVVQQEGNQIWVKPIPSSSESSPNKENIT